MSVAEEAPTPAPYSFGNLCEEMLKHTARKRTRNPNLAPAHVIIFEGIIGVGKTTVIKHAAAYLRSKGMKVVEIYERVDLWTAALELFYSDKARFAVEFQTFVLQSRINELLDRYEEEPDADVYLIERSPFSDRWIFMRTLHEMNALSDTQMKMYDMWWAMWTRLVPFMPTAFVWVKADLDTIMARMTGRKRGGEGNGVPRDYQERLLGAHARLFDDLKKPEAMGFRGPVDFMVLDVGVDYVGDAELTEEVVGGFHGWLVGPRATVQVK
jgi:deoxyadenosine/deoxycytidine kinase